ncbi:MULTISPECIES: hypothetical protein [Paenibacillus]|uniref:DUF5590 domain-containing protein n=1 Tax=Paenibacillus violae TaxID=3077234 RepID=A0ABU3RKZ7_9BACL|nr:MULTISPECIES: hypothetical protein [Paenibacillus]MDU0204766.1 hypothetical protein [Paenibacillus sp. PFR10]MEC0270543.1 hypothetical protein [Paenibacillus anseongense]
MKKSRLTFFTLTILLLIIGFSAYYINDNKHVYGNDKDSIEKVIKSIKGYENKSIEILEVKDFNDRRVVGFLSNNSPGYIQFRKNEDGNFLWSYIQVSEDEKFSSFIPEHLSMFMIVANNENEIAKMQVSINGQKLEQRFIPYKATVAWVNFPDTDSSQYEFRNYKYYDKDGNLIKEIN